jgi:hypothetical protein
MDELKKYLQNNLDKLDVETPGEEVWQNIRKEFQPSRPSVIPMVFKWAVAACIILLAGVGVYFLLNQQDSPYQQQFVNITPQVQPNVEPAEVNDTFPSPHVEKESVASNVPSTHQRKIQPFRIDKRSTGDKPRRDQGSDQASLNSPSRVFNDMEKSFASMVDIQLEKVRNTPIYAEDENYFHLFKKQFQDLGDDEKQVKDAMKRSGVSDELVQRMIDIYQEKISLLKQLQFEINKMNNRVKSNADVQKQTPTYMNL